MSGSSQIPGERQSQFKPADTLTGAEQLAGLQAGGNVNITIQQVLDYIAQSIGGSTANVLDLNGDYLTTPDGLYNVTY